MRKDRTRRIAPHFRHLNAETQFDWNRRHTFERFDDNPISAAIAGGAAGGSAGNENVLLTAENAFEYHIMGTQTIKAPSKAATGLDISMDNVDNDGIELTQGILAGSKHAYTIGTDGPFFLRVKFSIADVSGTDDCAVGFRLAEAYQANIDDYNDMACLNVISGAIYMETIVGGASTVPTDTTDTWGDGDIMELKVVVSDAGVVTYQVDGAAPTVVAAFTFTDTIVVVPFVHYLHATTTPGAIILQEWECGLVNKYNN